jgi:tRNA(Ile)-lysidine synthase
MHKFVRNLITEWRKLGLPFSDETIVVAVSGGADSVSLLLAIDDLIVRKKLRLRVIVAHFNHRLRGEESDADESFVRETATALGFEFVSKSSTIKRKGNLEQNSRDARYKFLADTARWAGAQYVLTAHTQNDQAETFLMNLIRGSGPDGLAGMSSVRNLNGSITLARPLLSWALRENTEEFCRQRDVDYRSDRMNDDETFTRVRIRKAVLPMLSELNPRIVGTLARTAELLARESSANAHENGKPQAASPLFTGDRLDLKSVKPLTKQELYAGLRSWLRARRGNLRSLQLKHIEAIERLINSRKSGKTVELPGGGAVVKQGGSIVFANIKVEK